MNLSPQQLASYLDATNLSLGAKQADIQQLCEDALAKQYAAVCIYPSYLDMASKIVKGSGVRLATVAGFPHGRSGLPVKLSEMNHVVAHGADEVDVVMDYSRLLNGEQSFVEDELSALSAKAKELKVCLKVIVETCYLNEACIKSILPLCEKAGVDFIKTSTGFGSAGANLQDVALWNSQRKRIKIKASGGIKTLKDAMMMISAGADRLGVSAASAIIKECQDSYNV